MSKTEESGLDSSILSKVQVDMIRFSLLTNGTCHSFPVRMNVCLSLTGETEREREREEEKEKNASHDDEHHLVFFFTRYSEKNLHLCHRSIE